MSNAQPGTPLPWRWQAEDESLLSLVGEDDCLHHVLSSQKCKSCNGSKRICLQPSEQDAAYIVEACNAYPELQAKLADTEFLRSAMQADLEAAGKLLGCDFDQVVVTLEEREKPCVWTWESGWNTTCGALVQNHVTQMKFCPYCGHPIKEQSEETNEPS